MSRHHVVIVVLFASLLTFTSGCGTYRLRFQQSKIVPEKPYETRKHAHGMGLVGGGGFFFAIHQMFPALVDYTGPQQVTTRFSEVSHYQGFGQNAAAAFFSWLTLVNFYHMATIEIR